MRRWTLVCVVALQAAVLITLSGPMGAMAATSTSTNFKGKASVYYRNSGPYFVVNFTCSNGGLSGNWTFDTRTNSYTGTLGKVPGRAGTPVSAPCALVQANGTNGGWSSSNNGTSAGPFGESFGGCTSPCIPLQYGANNATVGYLTLKLLNIMATKTYVSDTSDPSESGTCPNNSSSPPACIQITTSPLASPIGGSFDSTQLPPTGSGFGTPYGTLNMTLP